MTNDEISGLHPHYQTYSQQKCFIAYSEQAHWSVDLLSACDEILRQPEFNLEVDYARRHFAADVPLRQKALELIANARYGIYDLSYWQQDKGNEWQMPRNVLIELGVAIALNRPVLLLRHASNRELELPNCLQCISDQILEFSGVTTLKEALNNHLPKLIVTSPKTAWWNRYCIFGQRTCEYREAHPKARQLGKKELGCLVADGRDVCRPDFRGIVEDVLNRFNDIAYTYLDSPSSKEGYSFLLCTHCQITRSSPFAIYRITPETPADAFISIGISLALETQFEYNVPKILITESIANIPSLLAGYEVVIANNDKERKAQLKTSIPTTINKIRGTAWKPRPLPFMESLIHQPEEIEFQELQDEYFHLGRTVFVSNLSIEVTVEDIKEVWQEYGTVVEVYLPSEPNTGHKLGFALIEMEEIEQAEQSIAELDGVEWLGLELILRKARLEDFNRLKAEYQSINDELEIELSSNSSAEDIKEQVADSEERMVRATPGGLDLVDEARQTKGWKKEDVSWAKASNASIKELRNFWNQSPLPKSTVSAIIAAVGLTDLEEVIDPSKDRGRFSVLRTKITDAEILKSSLRSLGISVKTFANVRGYKGQRVRADVVAVLEGEHDIGWSRNANGTFDVTLNIWGVARKYNQLELINSINQKYAINKTLAEVKRPDLTNSVKCPRCDSSRCIRHSYEGTQGYRCQNCGWLF